MQLHRDAAFFYGVAVSAVLAEVSRLIGAEPLAWWRPADELANQLGDRLI
jgi:hypothetical protein